MSNITPLEFVEACKTSGVNIDIDLSRGIIMLTKSFPAGDASAFAGVENDTGIIYSVPTTRSGSTWGTTGDTVGGWAAVKNGMMRIYRSGCSKRFLAAVSKLLEAK